MFAGLCPRQVFKRVVSSLFEGMKGVKLHPFHPKERSPSCSCSLGYSRSCSRHIYICRRSPAWLCRKVQAHPHALHNPHKRKGNVCYVKYLPMGRQGRLEPATH